MKNYREFKRYKPEEWEDNIEWKGLRLSFLFDMQLYYSDIYMKLKLNKEKYDFYSVNDGDVSRIASEDHYSVNTKLYDSKFSSFEENELRQLLEDLIHLKNNKPEEFLLKKNCNLYEYLSQRLK